MYFDLFLSYKIERAVYPGFESDTRFALAAISDEPQLFSNFRVLVEQAKADYLRTNKSGSLVTAGLESITTSGLEELIKAKVEQNYIYSLRFVEEHNTSLFNIMLEIGNTGRDAPVKLMAALEYQPQNEALRVVTLY